MRINNFQISMMFRDGMSVTDISNKTGIEPEEITRRLKAYDSIGRASVKASAVRAIKNKHSSNKHPERNSQFAEKGG